MAERPRSPESGHFEILTLEEVERRHVLKILRACNGSRAEAARILGIDRKTLARKLSRWSTRED
jgi:DNA-binding NtrC family response regulator